MRRTRGKKKYKHWETTLKGVWICSICTDHFELNKFCFLAWTRMMMIKLQKKTGWKHSANMELKCRCNVFKWFWLVLLLEYNINFREDVDKMFKELDKNFDGKLSWKEFIGEETTIERAFKLFDENNDGTISKAVSSTLQIRAWAPC